MSVGEILGCNIPTKITLPYVKFVIEIFSCIRTLIFAKSKYIHSDVCLIVLIYYCESTRHSAQHEC